MNDKKPRELTLPPVEAAKPKPRGLDPELQAMAKIDRILGELSDNAATRIMAWLVARRTPGKFRIIIGSDPIEEPAKE